MAKQPQENEQTPFIRSVELREPCDRNAYPASIPAIAKLGRLVLAPTVTFLVGENGSGKSTLLEAIAVAYGFNAEGGSRNFAFSTRASHSSLHEKIVLAKSGRRPKDGFFLRSESFFNVATEIEALDEQPGGRKIMGAYGDRPLHDQSHGEAFLSLLTHRFRGEGVYLLDEPEAALSPARQLAALRRIHDLAGQGSQFVVATHSPILMACPGARTYLLDAQGIRMVRFEDTDHFQLTKRFVNDPGSVLRHLLDD